jgi:hypothetical protein
MSDIRPVPVPVKTVLYQVQYVQLLPIEELVSSVTILRRRYFLLVGS